MRTHFALITSLALTTAACGPRPAPTTDPEYVRAADTAGPAVLALEVAAFGAGFFAGSRPSDTVDTVIEHSRSVLGVLFHGCADVSAPTSGANGVRIRFASAGCGVADTPVRATGAVTLEAARAGDTASYRLVFEQFAFAGSGVAIDGALALSFVDDDTVAFRAERLSAGGGLALDVTARAALTRARTIATLDATGSLRVGDAAYALDVQSLERHLTTDCYPEGGSVAYDVPAANGARARARVEFDDSETALDSDDTGLVYLTLGGRREVAQLPSRACQGF